MQNTNMLARELVTSSDILFMSAPFLILALLAVLVYLTAGNYRKPGKELARHIARDFNKE